MLRRFIEFLDRQIIEFLEKYYYNILRISLGIVFLWFGFLKFFPEVSPAENLAGRTIEVITFGVIPISIGLKILALWETCIGLGLLTNRFMRVTIGLLWLQMMGAWMPLVVFPDEMFKIFPLVLTLEGQYIVKNLVLIAASFVIGSKLSKLKEETYVRHYKPVPYSHPEKCGEYL